MKKGILIISHGSRDAGWVKLVDEAVKSAAGRIRGRSRDDVPVVSAFLEIVAGRLIQDGIDELEAEGVTDVYVLPFFVSSGSTHVDDIAQAFGFPPVSPARSGELAQFRLSSGMRVRFGRPIGDDEAIAALLLEQIRELTDNPAHEALLLVAHGSSEPAFYDRWQAEMSLLAGRLRALGGFAAADTALLLPDQAAGKLLAMQRQHPENAVIVVPLFLSSGYFTRTVIPQRLAGFDYRYNGCGLLPHEGIVHWLERQITDGLQ
ncbi:sirohydrochlorin chelatase [Paenibacillus sp. GCM10027626]|uniref:sirohydrochlorin chelatase n=1 Tax=Paenibacillus sp. GCM10027626 TaxID=3273411 RepID=UPI0036303514